MGLTCGIAPPPNSRPPTGLSGSTRLAEIRIPTLVIHGALDRIVPAVNGQRLAGGVAGARLVVFPDAGHVYITDAPDAANQEVLRFLGDISGSTGSSSTGPAANPVPGAEPHGYEPHG